MYEREDEREKEFTEMDASSNSGKDVEGEDLEDNIDFVQIRRGFHKRIDWPIPSEC